MPFPSISSKSVNNFSFEKHGAIVPSADLVGGMITAQAESAMLW
ncbi:MAG: hypothetical protein R2822_25610 [Spirosomataceae bacterium]